MIYQAGENFAVKSSTKSKFGSERFFLDTNVLIYCFDLDAALKRKTANELVAHALSSGLGVVSHQVIQEFVSVASLKFRKRFDSDRLILYLDQVLFTLWKVYPSREMYIAAVQIQKHYQVSWWDSLIVAAALDVGCRIIFSEDLQHGLRIETAQILNPFIG
jgi:predicted nucleic acid-binding protein